MNIVFLTLGYPSNINEKNLYTDLMTSFVELGHNVSVFMQDETGEKKIQKSETGVSVIPVFTGKIKQTGLIKKGINLLLLGKRYYKSLKKNSNGKIDLLLYSTPPITFCNIIKTIKKKYNCTNYLLLKDIFPQNAVDLKMFSERGIFYKYFRMQEKRLYKNSDLIGCMSPANVNYLLSHNPKIDKSIVHISPNCMIPIDEVLNITPHRNLKLIYGGNLGKPQGIDFIIECCKVIEKYENVNFTIIGSGTEYEKLHNAITKLNLKQTQLYSFKPMDEYLKIMTEQDIGMIFLDASFSIPNFPSRVLDYLNKSIPIFACTDTNSDIKQEICDLGAGLWCRSDSVEDFENVLNEFIKRKDNLSSMRNKAKEIFIQKYNAETEAERICERVLAVNKL